MKLTDFRTLGIDKACPVSLLNLPEYLIEGCCLKSSERFYVYTIFPEELCCLFHWIGFDIDNTFYPSVDNVTRTLKAGKCCCV